MKKLLSLLLAALLVVCLLPMAAFSEEYNDGDEGGVQMTLTVEDSVQYTVTVSASPENYGTVTGGGTYDEGTVVTVTAIPASGYYFHSWYENGKAVENAGMSYTFTVTSDRDLSAVFEDEDIPTRYLDIRENEYFNVTKDPDKRFYNWGEMVTVTAVPVHGGVRFNGWWEEYKFIFRLPELRSADASYSFVMKGSTDLYIEYSSVQKAQFTPGDGSGDAFTADSLSANQKQQGYVIYTSDGPDDLKLHFPPADCFTAPEGKVFDYWEMNGVGYEAGSVQTVVGSGANPAFASDEITVTAKWKDDDSKTLQCVISVPALVEIPYGQEYTSVPWSVDTLELGDYDRVAVTFHDGVFRSQKNQEIRYSVKDIYDQDGCDSFVYKIKRPEELIVQVCIPKDSWDIAAPGNYTATMRFDVKGVYR